MRFYQDLVLEFWREQPGEKGQLAAQALERRLTAGDRLVVAAHALVEAYAVLTRLPAPHRLAPADAWALLAANFVSGAEIAALSGSAQVALLRKLSHAGIILASDCGKATAGMLRCFHSCAICNARHGSNTASTI